MDWTWKEGSLLHSYSENTPCKDIFQAVCDEIAEYYIPQGWKYARSRPKLTWKDKNLKIEIAFWSSGSNTPGDYVNLEIIPSIFSLELQKELKSRGEKSLGVIMGYPAIFKERQENLPKGTRRLITIAGEEKEFTDNRQAGVLRYQNNVNVYGISPADFMKIIDFINDRILIWKDLLEDYDQLRDKISSFLTADLERLKKADFAAYIQLKFPEKYEDFLALE